MILRLSPGRSRSPWAAFRFAAFASFIAAWVASSLGFASLAGCSEPPRGLVLWHAYRGAEQQALESVARDFTAQTGTLVTLLAVPYDAYAAKLEAAIPRDNGPDVFISPHERLGSYLANRLVVPANEAFPDSDLARYMQAATKAVSVEGRRYAVPLASKCVALYINPAILHTAPESLEELERLKGSLGPSVFPIAYEAQSVYFHAGILHAFGGQLFDGTTYAMVGPAAEQAASKARSLIASGVVPPEPSGDLVKQLFASGKAAAVISGPWLASDLGDSVPYRVVPLPRIESAANEKMRPFLTVDGAFITPLGDRKPEARQLARFLGSHESAITRRDVGKQDVATESAWSAASSDAPAAASGDGTGTGTASANANPPPPVATTAAMLAAFHAAASEAIPMPTSVAMRATWVPAEQALRKVLRGESAPKAALDEGLARYTDIMRPIGETPSGQAPSPLPIVFVIGLLLLAAAAYAVRRARQPYFAQELKASIPAYAYVAHSALTIFVLVVLPLFAGAALSFFAGTRESPRFVGFANYIEILSVRGRPVAEWLTHGSFYFTLAVTVLWTVVNIAAHVSIGLVLGTLLARPWLKLRAVYRVLLIVPWAVPSYVTALAWKGMFHRQFGAVNAILVACGVEPISWFAKFSTAFAANLATNIWLGFPFMMVVVMGALTSIPSDVLEAAAVDGATRGQTFRLVTLPLLKPTLLPAVVLGSVWTFNMFNVVFLVSSGEPDGATDILVSEAYRWAFARNAQLGYAAAYAVIIFGILALMTRTLGKLSPDKGAKT